MRGDGRQPFRPVPAVEQHAALEALMRTLSPSELVIPETILKNLPPRPSGYPHHRELFPRNTGMAFDPITPAVVASELTVSAILDPERAARLVGQKALDPSLPGLGDVIDELVEAGFDTPTANNYQAEVRRAVGRVVVERLFALGASAPMPQVRAMVTHKLYGLRDRFKTEGGTDDETAHYRLL